MEAMIEVALVKVTHELKRAIRKHGFFVSHHEAYAVLKEEVDEYWDSVKKNTPDLNELVQVAAMAIKAMMIKGETT